MAVTGQGAVVAFGGTAVAEYKGGTLEESHSPVDATRRSDLAPRTLPGRKAWTLNCALHYSRQDAAQLVRVGDEVEVTFYPEANSSGNEVATGTGRVDSVSHGVPEGDETVQKDVTISASDGDALVWGTVT